MSPTLFPTQSPETTTTGWSGDGNKGDDKPDGWDKDGWDNDGWNGDGNKDKPTQSPTMFPTILEDWLDDGWKDDGHGTCETREECNVQRKKMGFAHMYRGTA